jgi:hypothetical protein
MLGIHTKCDPFVISIIPIHENSRVGKKEVKMG